MTAPAVKELDSCFTTALYHGGSCPRHDESDCMACRNPVTYPVHAHFVQLWKQWAAEDAALAAFNALHPKEAAR